MIKTSEDANERPQKLTKYPNIRKIEMRWKFKEHTLSKLQNFCKIFPLNDSQAANK